MTSTTKTRLQIAAAAIMTSVTLALPSPSQATDTTSTSQYYCPSSATPWLCYSRLAGYKCFQHPECSGASSSAQRRY